MKVTTPKVARDKKYYVKCSSVSSQECLCTLQYSYMVTKGMFVANTSAQDYHQIFGHCMPHPA